MARIVTVMETSCVYRAEFRRHTGIAFIDDNVAARLSGKLTDDE